MQIGHRKEIKADVSSVSPSSERRAGDGLTLKTSALKIFRVAYYYYIINSVDKIKIILLYSITDVAPQFL